jgi:hypothetical protein
MMKLNLASMLLALGTLTAMVIIAELLPTLIGR